MDFSAYDVVSEKSATCFESCARHYQVSNWKAIGMVVNASFDSRFKSIEKIAGKPRCY